MKIDRLNLNYEFGKLRSMFAVLAVLALVLCSAFSARAQVTTAAVRGTVTDEQGAAIAGAEVTITNVDTSFNRTALTSSDGEYNFPNLPLAHSRIHATHSGSKSSSQPGITLPATATWGFKVALKVGALPQRVTVEAAP